MIPPDGSTDGHVEILISQDCPAQAAQLKRMLEQRGHAVTLAASSKEALAAARTRKPTLIVSDIVMPEMDGYTLCKLLKTEKELKNITVILMTSFSGIEEVVKGLECGADMFVRKPCDEAGFLARIEYALSNRRLREPAKMDGSLQIKLGDSIHHIISEPQQILDLLISTYEDAARMNAELGEKQKELKAQVVEERTTVLRAEIAEYKMAAEQLRQSEEQFRLIAENISDLIAVLDTEGRRLYNSPSYREILGDPTELRGSNSFDEIHPDDRERIRKIFEETVRTGRGQRAEYRFLLRDGSIRYIESQGSVIPDEEGKTAKVVVVSRDVTERKRVEEVLRQNETELREALLAARMGVWQWTVATDTVTWDENLYRISGRDPKLPAPSYTEHPQFFVPESWERLKAAVENALATGMPYELDLELVRPDGSKRWLIGRGKPLRDTSGHITQLRGTVQDITERKRNAEALRESEQRYRDFIMHTNEGVWCLEMEQPIPIGLPTEEVVRRFLQFGYIAECNDAYAHIVGFPGAEDLVRRRVGELFPASDEERLATFRESVNGGLRNRTIEFRARDKKGDFRHLLRSEVPIIQDGMLIRVWGITRDITKLRQAEDALRESEERYRRLFEVESDAILVIEVDTDRFLDANPAALRLYGYSREEFLFLAPGEVFADPGMSWTVIAAERDQGKLRWHRKKDGTVFPIELTCNSFVNQGQKIHVAVIRDISERLRAEVEHTRLVTAIEQSAEAVVITDTHGDIEYVNPAFTRISGYCREEVLGNNPRILKSDKQDAAFYQQLWGTILKGEIWSGEIVNRRKDGSLCTEEMNIAPVRNPLGEVTHFIATKQDVTEHKALEERLQRAAKMEAIGRLAGGVAHDFNNLLTIINGYSELGLDGLKSDDPMRSNLTEIMKASDRAASLARQLLAFSRLQVLAPQVLDLNGVVANVGEMLHRLIGEDINLAMVLDPVLGLVKADHGQIEQILMNLGINARDAMPEGGDLIIETANLELDGAFLGRYSAVAPGRYVMLAVSDTGIGMDTETQAHIFEPFFTTKERGKGTGLGLATVYGIVKQSGGYISVYSELGRGSTFKIYLPRIEGAVEPVQFSEAPEYPVAGNETILLVEDEEAVRALAARILQRLGYKVLGSASGEDAIQISGRQPESIHLLLTDLVLPGMTGRKVAELLAPLRPGMKVLYMSGYTDDSIVRSGVLEANTAFLQKPFTPASLSRKVREVLDAGPERRS